VFLEDWINVKGVNQLFKICTHASSFMHQILKVQIKIKRYQLRKPYSYLQSRFLYSWRYSSTVSLCLRAIHVSVSLSPWQQRVHSQSGAIWLLTQSVLITKEAKIPYQQHVHLTKHMQGMHIYDEIQTFISEYNISSYQWCHKIMCMCVYIICIFSLFSS